jgi:IS30 family transposase
VKSLLLKKWSPEQVVGYIRRYKLLPRPMSHETIYKYIWRDKRLGGSLWEHLRQSSKIRRKRYKAYDSRGRLVSKDIRAAGKLNERPRKRHNYKTPEELFYA